MSYIADIPYVGWVVPFLLVLGIVVFVHEYGHYIVGKWCGIKADVFSIGFGKELFHWIDKNGMRWRVGVLPLGLSSCADLGAGADRSGRAGCELYPVDCCLYGDFDVPGQGSE